MIRLDFKWIIIAIISLSTLLCMYFMGKSANRNQISDLQNIITTQKKESKIWKDEAGHWKNKTQAAEIKTNDALKFLSEHDARFAQISKEFEGVNKNLKNLQYVGFTGTSSRYEMYPSSVDTLVIFHKDTLKAKVSSYVDSLGWFSAKGIVINGEIEYLIVSTKDSLETVLVKHKKLFKAASFTQEIKSYNPNTKVLYNESVIVNKPKKFLGIF